MKDVALILYSYIQAVNWELVLLTAVKIIMAAAAWVWTIQVYLFIISFTTWRIFSTIAKVNHFSKDAYCHISIVAKRWSWLGLPVETYIYLLLHTYMIINKLCKKFFGSLIFLFLGYTEHVFFVISFFWCYYIEFKQWLITYISFSNKVLSKPQLAADCMTTIESSLYLNGKKVCTFTTVCKLDYKLYYQLRLGNTNYRLLSSDGVDRFFFFWSFIAASGGLAAWFCPRIAFLDTAGIDFPQNRTQYFWDATEFGRALRQQYFPRVDLPYRILDRDLWREKYIPRDFTQEFLDRVTRKHWAWKVWEKETYEEKTQWGWFYDRAEKIGIFLFCVVGLFFFFNACDNADWGDFMPPARDEGW